MLVTPINQNIRMKILYLLFILVCCLACEKTEPSARSRFESFSLDEVELLDGVFRKAQQTDLTYMLALDPDKLLAPYLREAGLKPKKESYGNWENTGLDGHIGGHYLSALSQMSLATGNKETNRRLDYMLSELKKCQDAIGTGYLAGTPGGKEMWIDIAAGKIKSDNFALNDKWVPLYNIHKLFAGLRDAYVIAKKPLAKEILVRLTDYIVDVASKLTDEQIQMMLVSEHGGLNEIFADVSEMTGDKKYLVLAKTFSHKKNLTLLANRQDSLTGLHANMQIPKAVGFQRISELDGDQEYANAARFFWETVVSNRSVAIGGNSVNEHFNPVGDYSDMMTSIAGPETCNSYNMLKLSRHLFETDGDQKYVAHYERTLFNHILSSQHPERGGFVYYTSMRPRHYRVYSQPTQCMWCCVGSGMENHGKYAELIYSHKSDDVYVNLFIASRLQWLEQGIEISQQTNFPDEESAEITIDKANNSEFDLYIRYPLWVARGQLSITLNGETISANQQPGSYVRIKRTWKQGDRIKVVFPMQLSCEFLPNDSSYVAFLHGPIVLAAKTDTTDLDNLIADSAQWEGYRARGKQYPIEETPTISIDAADFKKYVRPTGKPQTFTAPELISPAKFKDLELMPFYKVHDARYIIYWPAR
jgi:uncharacterized protein